MYSQERSWFSFQYCSFAWRRERGSPSGPLDLVNSHSGLICHGLLGFTLAVWTVALFSRHGSGTPSPWNPPMSFVVQGPYRHVRNPMILGVVLMLVAETLILRSVPVALWTAVFFGGNAVYFPLSEERRLEDRFGDSYRMYKANVPRWIPRLRKWKTGEYLSS